MLTPLHFLIEHNFSIALTDYYTIRVLTVYTLLLCRNYAIEITLWEELIEKLPTQDMIEKSSKAPAVVAFSLMLLHKYSGEFIQMP
jgi:hypothetical protein